jgi:hypothetical protein
MQIIFLIWRNSISGPIAPISSIEGGDDTTMYIDHATRAKDVKVSASQKMLADARINWMFHCFDRLVVHSFNWF